jgi:hypothetical protein
LALHRLVPLGLRALVGFVPIFFALRFEQISAVGAAGASARCQIAGP